MYNSSELEMARQAVTEQLKLDDPKSSNKKTFIQQHQEEIFNKLELLYTTYTTKEKNHEFAFIAASLPLISGIIHVGSTIQDYEEATEWIQQPENMPNADPSSALSALTFIYLVGQGIQYTKDHANQEKQKIWNNMKELVDRILGHL